jgi:prolyl-tRNA synthetase
MGALIMTHSDDQGLVLPPNLAPFQVVMVPIYKGEEQREVVVTRLSEIKKELEAAGVSVKLDDRDTHKPGWKFAEYELKGVPLRLAMGMRDIESGNIEVARRDTLEKKVYEQKDLVNKVKHLLENIQDNLYRKSIDFREENSHKADNFEEFKSIISKKGGFVYAHWDGTAETEEQIKKQTKATIRCIPLDMKEDEGKCIFSGKPSKGRVIFAKAY